MGGHDKKRSSVAYRQIATISRTLSRDGLLILTGGGPGLMEAANLGAFLGPFPDEALDHAINVLRKAEDFGSHEWLSTACAVRADLLGDWEAAEPDESFNLGVPTWLYGHEPPNLFATHSGKMFFNSLREDGLVSLADGGILFGEGNAGTVQELFQDVTQNYYREKEVVMPTPIVLLDRTYWTRASNELPVVDPATGKVLDKRKPVWPLLNQLAAEKNFTSAILVSDDSTEIIKHLRGRPKEATSRRVLAWRGLV